jgi:AcrR family transcriptional regulator
MPGSTFDATAPASQTAGTQKTSMQKSGQKTARALKAQQTRHSILVTAQRLFARDGYDATSLQMIADDLGLAKAAVYYYFPTKAGILHALAADALSALDSVLEAAAQKDVRRERVRTVVDGWVELIINTRGITLLKMNDPAVQRELELGAAVRGMEERGLRILFGDDPEAEDYVAYYLVLSLREVATRLAHLDDEKLRAALTQTGLRLMRATATR